MQSAPNSPPIASFRVQILGPFGVEREGIALDMTRWQRRTARLFKLLAVAPHRRRTRDELLGLLWPDSSEEAGGANLRLVVHRLRRTLTSEADVEGASPILSEHGWVGLNPAYSWDLDLDRFTELAETADGNIAALEKAADLYRGPALEDESYEDWAMPYRDQVSRQWRQVCLRLATLHRGKGSPERAVEWLERLLDTDPLDEEALRQLLITLELLTRETEALRRFHKFEQLLSQELDVPPDAETLAVAARVAEHLRESEVTVPAVVGLNRPEILPVEPSYPLSTVIPLIGRRQELAWVSGTLTATDSLRAVLLAGEAGMGKTRILAEAAVRARQGGILTLAGGSYEQEGQLPYGPIHDALLDYFHTQPQALIHTQLNDVLPRLALVVPELRPRLVSSSPEWPGDADSLRLQLFSAVAEALRRIAEDRPILLLLDDLHWADESTLQLLHYLLRQTNLAAVRIIAAYRLEEVGSETPLARWLADAEDDDRIAIRTPLNSLSPVEMKALLEERLRGPCSEGLSHMLHERSAGNPFFALQMLRLLQQEGRLEQSGEGWRVAPAGRGETGDDILLPVKVRRTVARRLRNLSRPEHESLVIGAVMGRAFSYAGIEALWDGEPSALFQALEGAVNAYLLTETERGFAFRHPILREVVYQGISRHRRRQLHRRAAVHLQALYGPPDERCTPQHAVQLAWHFLQGEELEQALGYAQLAGDHALASFAYQGAAAQYRTALDLARRLDDAPAERRALEQFGRALSALGRYREAEAVLEQAATQCAVSDEEGQRRVVALIGQLHVKTGELEHGIQRVTRALHTLDSPTPSPGLGALYLALASLSFRTGKYRDQMQAAERTIQISQELEDSSLRVQAHLLRAYSLPWLGSTTEFRQALEEVAASAEAIGDLPTLARSLCALSDPYTALGDFDRAREALARAMEITERVGDPSSIAFTANMSGLIAFSAGDWSEAEDFFARALTIYRELGALVDTMIPLYGLGAVRMSRGDWEEGTSALEQHIALAHETGDFRWLHMAHVLLAERDLLTGRPNDALARLQSVTELPDLSDIARSAVTPTLAWTYLELGDTDRAVRTAMEVTARAEEEHQVLIESLRVQGAAQARQGCTAETDECFRRALHLLEQTPFRYERGRTMHDFGAALADRGEPERARAALEEALDIFRGLEARPYVERTRRAIAGLTEGAPAGRRSL